jgi:uncharacterized protein (DUF302 family)
LCIEITLRGITGSHLIACHGFGVLHVPDLGTTLYSKGITFDDEYKVLEVCNLRQAAKVLSTDMRLNMALMCRVSIFAEKGKTTIGLLEPLQMLSAPSQDTRTMAREGRTPRSDGR